MESNTELGIALFLYKEAMLEIGRLTQKRMKNLSPVEAHRLVQIRREALELREILDRRTGVYSEE